MSKKSRRVASEATEGKSVQVDKSVQVPQREKINFQLTIKERSDLTDKQNKLINLILDKETKVIFVFGPAGTAKTYISILAGLKLLNKRGVSDIIYIRSAIESASRSLGFLPGEQGDKMEPYCRPLREKLDELLPDSQVSALIKEKRADGVPLNFLRGASFNAKFIVLDEAQNCDFKEITTVLTRIGKFSKLIITADPDQSDINGRSGAMKMFDLFNDEQSRAEGIHCFSFTNDDIVRSGIVKYIAGRLEAKKIADSKSEPMFDSR